MKFIALLIFAAALVCTAPAQSPTKILKQAEKALGGAKVLRSLKSKSVTGSIKRVDDGAVGKYSMYSSKPNRFHMSYDVGGMETESGFNGRSAWTRNSRDGLSTLTGKAGSDHQAMAEFRNNLWLSYKKAKSRVTPGGKVMIDGKPANAVLLTTQRGVVIKIYFDPGTGLPVREEIPNGDDVDIYDHSDYRVVSGVKAPFATRLTTRGRSYEIRLDDVRINQALALKEFDFPVLFSEPLPDIPALLRDLQANEDRVEGILDSYSFTQKIIKRELGKDGILREKESETFQLSFYKGRRISRLIEKDGRPLSEKDQADADRAAAKRVDEYEKQDAKDEERAGRQSRTGEPSREGGRISIAEVLRASNLINPRRERLSGRDVIVFDFEPNPAFDMKNAKSMIKFFGKTAGVMWIDEHDKQVARVEAVLFESFKVGGGLLAKLQKGASFTLEQERVGDEIWLPSQADINLSVRVLLVKGIEISQVVRSYGYRKFETEVWDATVGEPAVP